MCNQASNDVEEHLRFIHGVRSAAQRKVLLSAKPKQSS
jgi:hypothetical protein